VPQGGPATGPQAIQAEPGAPETARRDVDLALYDRVIERIGAGENYYQVAAEEHRRIGFPLRPGATVRLPTLAYLAAWLGPIGLRAAATLLLGAVVLAWWRRLGEEPGGKPHRAMGTALAFAGAGLCVNANYYVMHELWAGVLLSLALALHRPGRAWGAALLLAALALAIRELALPFVLLMGAMAIWRRDWREATGWSALALVFLAAMSIHFGLVAAQILPTDPFGPSWLTWRGLGGWTSNVVLSSILYPLPGWLAGPVTVLMVFGWTAWRSSVGAAAALYCLGMGLAFCVVGRPNNFYWGAMVAPILLIGLAFAPRALAALVRAAAPATAPVVGEQEG
jgi:hypothetical protein